MIRDSLRSRAGRRQLSEVLHLLTDHLNAALVRRVELQHPLTVQLRPEHTTRNGTSTHACLSTGLVNAAGHLTRKALEQPPGWWTSFLFQEVHRTAGWAAATTH